MVVIKWCDDFSVGVKEIDDQHKVLIGMINELDDALQNGHAYEVAIRVVVKMTAYVDVHFSTEEKYFAEFNYLDTEEHICEHREFADKIKEFEEAFIEGSTTLSEDVITFLHQWLRKHIQDSDQKYVSCFNAHGLK